MTGKDKTDWCVELFFVGLLLVVVLSLAGVKWYCSGVQAEVYERQGIRITQWEIFWGATPAEKVIQIRG